jgi:hypothetical protein
MRLKDNKIHYPMGEGQGNPALGWRGRLILEILIWRPAWRKSCSKRVSLPSTHKRRGLFWSCHSTKKCHDARLLQTVVDILRDAKPRLLCED